MLRCSLSYAKKVQTECRILSLLEYYAEVQPFLCKDTLFIETTIEMVAN